MKLSLWNKEVGKGMEEETWDQGKQEWNKDWNKQRVENFVETMFVSVFALFFLTPISSFFQHASWTLAFISYGKGLCQKVNEGQLIPQIISALPLSGRGKMSKNSQYK